MSENGQNTEDVYDARDRDRAAALLAGHLARTGLEVCALPDPGYEPAHLKTAVVDAGGEPPKKRRARTRTASA